MVLELMWASLLYFVADGSYEVLFIEITTLLRGYHKLYIGRNALNRLKKLVLANRTIRQ